MEKEENILGWEKISKLMLKFSVPCIISLLVNSLYNIVDQIFIGNGVGYLGNGATNVVFPITMICLAFSLMFGDGASAYLSLKLGEEKKDEAAKGVINGVIMSVISSLIICAITIIFLPQLLNLFGCTEALKDYALTYGGIISIGIPFMMIGTTLNSIIRADGSPKYSMFSMVAGAILNTCLDPILIFVFNMGVAGAAIATILSQILTFILNVAYLKKLKTVKISKKEIKINFSISKKVAMLGISSFITQMSFVFVSAVANNLLAKYGSESKYGSEIPITVLGIVMKINQILTSIIIGVSAGSQPIMGYNYGAGKGNRVKSTLKIVLGVSVFISTIAFVLFQTIPDKLISIFGSGDELYIEFACLAFRRYLLLCILNGVQIPSGIFFQAIGKSVKSALLSLSRQIIFLIPGFIILGKLLGVEGILYAAPVADGLAFIIATTLILREIKHLNNSDIVKSETNTKTEEYNSDENKIIITIAREYGSGGRYIGDIISKKLGIKLYDKELTTRVAKESGLTKEYIENNEQQKNDLANFNNGYYVGLTNADELYLAESKVIKEIADKESCVIIGRCANFTLKEYKNVFKIFIYSDMKNKIERATKFYGLDPEKAEKEINKINKLRANHYRYYTESEWNSSESYDLCINSDLLGVEKTADLICNIIKNSFASI
jgi:putative MATE family efflux protein